MGSGMDLQGVCKDEFWVLQAYIEQKELKMNLDYSIGYITYNIIPKKGHYNQVIIMDSFIIYRAAIDEPLNMDYNFKRDG